MTDLVPSQFFHTLPSTLILICNRINVRKPGVRRVIPLHYLVQLILDPSQARLNQLLPPIQLLMFLCRNHSLTFQKLVLRGTPCLDQVRHLTLGFQVLVYPDGARHPTPLHQRSIPASHQAPTPPHRCSTAALAVLRSSPASRYANLLPACLHHVHF